MRQVIILAGQPRIVVPMLGDLPQGILQDPAYQAAWAKVQAQLKAEGQDVAIGQTLFNDAISQIAQQSQQLDPSIYTAAAKLTIAAHTAVGAAQSIQGLVQAFQNPNTNPGAVMSSFAGVLVGAGTAAGILTAGVGAAIMGAVSIAASIIGVAFAVPPSPQTSMCGTNFDAAIGLTCIYNCIASNACSPVHVVSDPSSPNWQTFPDPNCCPNVAPMSSIRDSDWYHPAYANHTGGVAKYGQNGSVTGFFWGKTGTQWAVSNDGDVPIHNAFGNDVLNIQALSDLAAIPMTNADASMKNQFYGALVTAWKKNFEYVFNGLAPPVSQADQWKIFLQVVKTWNLSHLPGAGAQLTPGMSGSENYIGQMVQQIINRSSSDAPNNVVPINTGPSKTLSLVAGAAGLELGGSATPTTTSTGKKVAIAGGAAVGASALAIAVASWLTHQTFLTVADKAWDWVKDTVTGKGKSGYRASAIPGARENPLRCPTGSQVVSLLFSRRSYSPSSASKWARSRGYRSRTEAPTGDYIHVPQRDPRRFSRIRTVTFGRGIKARVGWRRC